MNTKKILDTIHMTIAGIHVIKEVRLNNSYIIFYRCENCAFNDIEHMYNCFQNAIDSIKRKHLGNMGLKKAEKLNNNVTLMKVIVYE